MCFLWAFNLWLPMHVYTNTEPLHALPLCYSPLNFWKRMDKKCKTVHQPHYDIWWNNQEYDSELLLLENYRIQSLCSPFLHTHFPCFKRFLSLLWKSHLDSLLYTSPRSTLPEWVTFTKHLDMGKEKNHKMSDLPNKMGVHCNNLLLG